jgi:hypothetical protein
VFILEGLKVLCFDTLLQVFILKVDSGIAGALAEFFALRIPLQVICLGNVGGKGVRWLAGYFMGYYTIWLAPVKRYFGFILGIAGEDSHVLVALIKREIQNPPYKPRLRHPACGTRHNDDTILRISHLPG